jgi:hypothetical protein
MGRRSDFKRRPMDSYETPPEAVLPLIPFIEGLTFAEPCAGRGKLVRALENHGLRCFYQGDILYGEDALERDDYGGCDVIITNPPWTRQLMHPLLEHFMRIGPTWILVDADWMHNQQAAPYIPHCSHIVSVGRIKWMPGSESTGKDNACWMRFQGPPTGGPKFYGRQVFKNEKKSRPSLVLGGKEIA